MNYYPDALRVIIAHIDALNAVDKDVIDAIDDITDLPYPVITLRTRNGEDFGTLRDEIGGSWSWFPAEEKKA